MKTDYILVVHQKVNKKQFQALINQYDITVNIDFNGLNRHFELSFDDSRKRDVKADPRVLHVCESDAEVILNSEQVINVNSNGMGGNWGLTRICHRQDWNDNTWYPNSGIYTYFRTGKGVDVYIVDTGARLTHNEFTDRIEVIYDHYRSANEIGYGEDLQGHGTHVASTVAGTKYGVAKEAKILVSRVFEEGGAPLSAIIAGINACLAHHKNKKTSGINRPSIMNLSLGGPAHIIEEQAINDCIDNGIVCVAAAGNDGKDLSEPNFDVMPAEIARAVTVGSVDIRDNISSFSNYGWQVDTFAPGHYITAAGFISDDAEAMSSGTSMAAPHVAGVCALYLESFGMTESGAHVKIVHDWIWNNSTNNTIHLNEGAITSGTANKIVFSDFITEKVIVPEPTPEPITEVNRTEEIQVETQVDKSQPSVTTTFQDLTEIINNDDGSVTTKVTRIYTDTSIITITTTITTIITTVITYSDGTTEILAGNPIIDVVITMEESVSTRTETISEETVAPEPTPEPIPEPTPEPIPEPEPTPEPIPEPEPTKPIKGRKKGWYKRNRKILRTKRQKYPRSGRYAQLRELERMYDKMKHDIEIEDLMDKLETLIDEIEEVSGQEKMLKLMEFISVRTQAMKLIKEHY